MDWISIKCTYYRPFANQKSLRTQITWNIGLNFCWCKKMNKKINKKKKRLTCHEFHGTSIQFGYFRCCSFLNDNFKDFLCVCVSHSPSILWNENRYKADLAQTIFQEFPCWFQQFITEMSLHPVAWDSKLLYQIITIKYSIS